MKKLITILFVAALSALSVSAAPTLLLGNLITVNNTTSNSPATTALNWNPTTQQFTISHGALTGTNALTLNIQATTDQTNYITIGTWKPSFTNATTETIPANAFSITNYIRVQAVTTNSVTVGGSYGS